MIREIDQVHPRWQRVEADRPPQRRKDRQYFQNQSKFKSRTASEKREAEEPDDSDHLDVRV
jgi:hypothetical protein